MRAMDMGNEKNAARKLNYGVVPVKSTAKQA